MAAIKDKLLGCWNWFLNIRLFPKHVFALLLIFWMAWLYTEISEYFAREVYYAEVEEFIHRGDRFTLEDGMALDSRIDKITAELNLHLTHSAKYTQLILQLQRDIERIEDDIKQSD